MGRDLAGLDDPGVRLPRNVVNRLFAYAEDRTGDRLIGLHAGERARFRGPIAHLFASAPRLRQGLELYRARYRATDADQGAWARARRPKPCRLAVRRRLRQLVASKLSVNWSPEQISG